MPSKTTSPEWPEGLVVTNVRLPVPLHQQLLRAAKASFRSQNSEIIWRLQQSLRPKETV
jgi:hypothetical protein